MISRTLIAAVGLALGLGVGAAIATPFRLAVGTLVLLLCVPLVGRLLRRGWLDPFEPLWPFLICYGIAYALKPLLDAAGDRTHPWFEFSLSAALMTILIAAGSLLFVYLAYFSGVYRVIVPMLPLPDTDPTPQRARIAALVLAAGGMMGLALLVRAAGPDFSLMAATRGAYRLSSVRAAYGQGYLFVLCTLAQFAPALQIAVALSTKKKVDWGLALLVFAAVLTMLVVLYSRQLMLQTIVMILVVMYFRARWLSASAVVICGVVIALVGGYLGIRLRTTNVTPLSAFGFLGHTFDSSEFVPSALDRISPFGHFGGLTYIEDAVLTFIPRSFFPEKPDVFGIVRIQNHVAPDLSSSEVWRATYPPGFLVEAYANFGLLGLVFIGLAYGAGLRVAREWFWPRRDKLFPMLVYGGFIMNMAGMFRTAAQMALQTMVYGAVLYLLLYGRIPMRTRAVRDVAA